MTAFLTTFLLIAMGVMPGIVASRLSGWFFGEAPWWNRLLAALCIYPLVIWAVLMVLAPFALMTLWPVFVLMLVATVATVYAIPAVPWRFGGWNREYIGPWWQVALGAGLAVAAFCVFFFSNFMTGPQYMSDDFAYHGPTIAGWFRTGTLNHPRTLFAAYYPFNGHMITYYAILPSGDLRWTWLSLAPWLLLAAVTLIEMTRHLPRYTLGWGLMTVVVHLVCSEVAWYHFFTLCPTDVQGAAAFLAGMVLGIPREGAKPREALARACLGAAMVGFAMGSKSTFALPGLFGGLGILMMNMLGSHPLPLVPRLWKTTGIMAIGGFVTGSYWYMWNWVVTGNPVFPARVWKFNGPGHWKSWGDSTLLYHLQNAKEEWVWWDALMQSLNYPWKLGILGACGIVVCSVFIARQVGNAITRRDWPMLGHPLIWMYIAGASLLVQYPFMPFSGSFLTDFMVVSQRYFIVFFLVGFISLCWFVSYSVKLIRHRVVFCVVDGLLFLGLVVVSLTLIRDNSYSVGNTQTVPAVITGAIVTVLLLVFGYRGLPWPPRIGRPVVIGGAVALLLCGSIAGAIRERILPPPYMRIINIWWTQPVPPIIDALDKLPDGSRIGEFSMNVWEYWYICGSRMQHIPVPMWEGGLPMPEVHVIYEEGLIEKGFHRLGLPRERHLPNPDSFSDNLRSVDLDYLLVTQYDSGVVDGAWPPQREHIQRMPEFELIWSHEHSELYRRIPDSELGRGDSQAGDKESGAL